VRVGRRLEILDLHRLAKDDGVRDGDHGRLRERHHRNKRAASDNVVEFALRGKERKAS
jgi:hypothetical protein